MNIKIATKLIVLMFFFRIGNVFSQSITFNWTFFVDGKIPETADCWLIIPQDDFNDSVNCEYRVGEFVISKDILNMIMRTSSDNIVLNFIYTDYKNKYAYPLTIQKSFFLPNYSSYIIFNIDNINIKKRKYYIEIIGEGFKVIPPYPRKKSMYNVFNGQRMKSQHRSKGTDTILMKKVP